MIFNLQKNNLENVFNWLNKQDLMEFSFTELMDI